MDAAFETGAGISPATLSLGIAEVIVFLMLLWVAWVASAQLRLWRNGQAELYDLLWTTVRATLWLLVLGFLLP